VTRGKKTNEVGTRSGTPGYWEGHGNVHKTSFWGHQPDPEVLNSRSLVAGGGGGGNRRRDKPTSVGRNTCTGGKVQRGGERSGGGIGSVVLHKNRRRKRETRREMVGGETLPKSSFGQVVSRPSWREGGARRSVKRKAPLPYRYRQSSLQK